ncbi:hypothetical protein [Clostridium saccharoperbutylacetonicum]|uniref:hypothetical protein n=1 Tax=Clostridium saccharoperbutylacetonicum TaxID=36745 RepID=UPI0039EA501C
MEERINKVYVCIDTNNVITKISSNVFISDLMNWIEIDKGNGDKYAHAQNNYLENGLIDYNSKYNYKLVNNKAVELTQEEKEKLFPTQSPEPIKTAILQKQLLETQAQLASLQEQILLNQTKGK